MSPVFFVTIFSLVIVFFVIAFQDYAEVKSSYNYKMKIFVETVICNCHDTIRLGRSDLFDVI